MTNYLVFVGKNVEKALELAGKELSRDVGSLKYDVVSYGSTGIFGLVGARKAKIHVMVPQEVGSSTYQKEAKQEAKDLVEDAFDLNTKTVDPSAVETPDQTSASGADMSQAMEVGKRALEKITNAISEETIISIENRQDRLLFKIDGGNSAILIGKRGQTLEAIQYLVEKIVNKQANTRIRVLVDVKGYLGTRKASLIKLATRLAEKAQKNRKPVTVGQMNAYDRRIVHMSLKDNPEVRTQSMGDGYYRKLVIFPKKRKGRKSQSLSEEQ